MDEFDLEFEDYGLKVDFNYCPVEASLGVLGHKWTLLIIRNIGLYRKQRFNEMLKITPGLTKRVLSMRLKELESDNFIEVVDKGKNYTKWDLTQKGKDSLAILMVMVQFGAKYYAEKVFEDKRPRQLNEIFDDSYIQETMQQLTIDNDQVDADQAIESSLKKPITSKN